MAISKSTYLKRRKQLIEQLDNGIILLLGNEEVGMNYPANTYHFRQDSSFLYFTGINKPNFYAILDVDEYKTHLFADDYSLDDIVWLGDQPTVKEQAQAVGIQNTGTLNDLNAVLSKAIEAGRTIHFLPPYRLHNTLKLSKWLGIPLEAVKQQASPTLNKAVVLQRSVKDQKEIAEMEKAVNISKAIHETMMRRARVGMKESELAGIAEGIALAMGGSLAYPPIVTVNGQTLHNHYRGNTLTSGQMILADVGADVPSVYASDITRTFPVDKTFTDQQKAIYEIVLKANLDIISLLKPDIYYKEMHLKACQIIAEGLTSIGLMKGNPLDAMEAGAHALFMPHGLGHMIGLDVHDMEDLGEKNVGYADDVERSEQFGTSYLRLAKKLEPGYVLTVEPGIYFIPQLIEQWQSERKFADFINYEKLEAYHDFGGIRIEDDVLITAGGYKVLGKPIAKTIEEVEALRK